MPTVSQQLALLCRQQIEATSYAQFSEATAVDVGTLHRWLAKGGEVKSGTVDKLAAHFGLSLNPSPKRRKQ